MKLKDQVVSLELSQKLKELGVKKPSLWFWVETDHNPNTANLTSRMHAKNITSWHRQTYSAYTVAELGEMLPPHYMTVKSSEKELWHCADINDFIEPDWKDGKPADTEADARAKMLIYLIENKLINA